MNIYAQQIAELQKDCLTATDEGTHSHPRTFRIFERLDGSQYVIRYHSGAEVARGPLHVSPHELQTPGYVRWIGCKTPSQRRREIARLHLAEAVAATAPLRREQRRRDLLAGWDGWTWIGTEKGAELAASEKTKESCRNGP